MTILSSVIEAAILNECITGFWKMDEGFLVTWSCCLNIGNIGKHGTETCDCVAMNSL